MKIKISNIGAIKNAIFSLADITIICGKNNTGKTYAVYALYGFFKYWKNNFSIKISNDEIRKLLNEGIIEIDLNIYINDAKNILDTACNNYIEKLPQYFGAPEKYFEKSKFSIELEKHDIRPLESFERMMGASKTRILSMSKKESSHYLVVSLLVEKEKVEIPKNLINRILGDALKDIIFGNLFTEIFIASAERTGAAIFRKELNFARNRIIEEMGAIDNSMNPLELLSKVYSDYPLPVRDNVDFTRELEKTSLKESFIAKEHSKILEDFSDIIGGKYLVYKSDELYYVPKKTKIRLTMDQSSSAVRSLLDIGFYLRHVAAKNDLLIIDEPELNLHPENQRRVARLLTKLVNIGIKVCITTHSDYIIKELNTLIMLRQSKPYIEDIIKHEGYHNDELLDYKRVKAYVAEDALIVTDENQRRVRAPTLVEASIDPMYGIKIDSFDNTIDEMNRIQGEIIWGDS
ncbi:hypothetical protein Lrub_0711 [Legionella rubrilucens]|uniref:Endonuclease GajA/Old nuclease/RecF-like AAA domain-containing protein n=1 Tax=Legionella rubrilucens TaxID=458 RepID=A0A0W0XY53_9GAMM|nr:AAA family ATPase [Legionella rubrilucens]KTD49612.1 hypothetical protein Lrub_0711 [Legionella rubrilucens]